MRSVAALVLVLVAAACSGVSELGKPQRRLPDSAVDATRAKVDQALKDKQFKVAWNLQAAASASEDKDTGRLMRDKPRFETIALETLKDEDGDAKDMLDQIRGKLGGYSDDLKREIASVTRQAILAKEYKRATDIQILAADDAPEYRGAWDVYSQTPAKEALAILERINDARQKFEEEKAKKKGP